MKQQKFKKLHFQDYVTCFSYIKWASWMFVLLQPVLRRRTGTEAEIESKALFFFPMAAIAIGCHLIIFIET